MLMLKLFLRSLLDHLLLIVTYLLLGLAWLSSLDLPIALVGLVVLLIGLNTAWVQTNHYYPAPKLLVITLAGFVMGMGALAITPKAIIVAFILTLLMMHYPCKNCIRYRWPHQLQGR
ncbi:hypothetical protein [Thiosulfativibrio zosterae]|uniref:Uncharacterized protein n=1 Tax=Thiosulfativibrio zosterae TaxID=2675053 RepID=A0A6F8PQX6_9GAMM|nr:hypothetical protein [Thiosulfativibrio zosterae]BBP44532.1 hypothetical protein THMIRHAT_22780 [Thiosulfativibrio zosterae]